MKAFRIPLNLIGSSIRCAQSGILKAKTRHTKTQRKLHDTCLCGGKKGNSGDFFVLDFMLRQAALQIVDQAAHHIGGVKLKNCESKVDAPGP